MATHSGSLLGSSPGAARARRIVAVLALALLAPACKTTQIEAETLPFHLALVPFEVEPLAPAPTREVPRVALLAFDGAELARGFGAALEGLSFTEVSVLALPPGVGAAEFAAWPQARRERHWLAGASACGADLLLLGEVEYDPTVASRVVARSLGRGVFEGLLKAAIYVEFNAVAAGFALLMTVTEWDNDERRHDVHVRFGGTLLELAPLLDPGSEADLGNRRTERVRSFDYQTDMASTFSDRQGWLGHALSIFVPGAFFPSNRAALGRSLSEHSAEALLAEFVEELEFRKSELLAGDDLFPFRVERLELEGDRTRPTLCVEVELAGQAVDTMDGYRLWIDGRLALDAPFAAPARQDGRARYALRLPLPEARPDSVLRLELRDGAPRQNVRSFTLRADRTGKPARKPIELHLPGPTEPAPAPAERGT